MPSHPALPNTIKQVDPDIQAPELLAQLFDLGTDLLVKNLEVVWAGMGELVAQPQVRRDLGAHDGRGWGGRLPGHGLRVDGQLCGTAAT